MESAENFMEGCRIDKDQPSVTERYFTPTMFPDCNQCALLHSNRLCIITLAPEHPILSKGVTVDSIKFDSVGNVNRLSNKVSGKFKKGGQKLHKKSVLCTVKCSDDTEYSLFSCVNGTLVEINEKLVENPQLLKDKPWSDGYVAIILPPFVSSKRRQKKSK